MATYTKVCAGIGSAFAGSPFTFRLVVSNAEVDAAKNKSKIKYSLYIDSTGARFSTWTCNYKLEWKSSATGNTGTLVNKSEQRSMPETRGESLLLFTETSDYFLHDRSGRCQLSLTATFSSASGEFSPGHATITANFDLTTINRESEIGSIKSFTFEDPFSVPITKHASAAVDELSFKIGGTTIKKVADYKSGASISLTDAELLAVYGKLPQASNSVDVLVTVTSAISGTKIGSDSKTVTGTSSGGVRVQGKGRGVAFVKTSSGWKRGIVYVRAGSEWKRGV